jgi:hypothetical protein
MTSVSEKPDSAWHGHILRARHNGLLKIDAAALQRLNSIPGIAVFTLATLFLISGSNALDPLDPIFGALQQLGAKIQRTLWIASWNNIAVIGLRSCGLGTPITAFDLILPRLLAEGSIGEMSF